MRAKQTEGTLCSGVYLIKSTSRRNYKINSLPRVKKRVAVTVSLGVMHIIRSETLGETFWREKSRRDCWRDFLRQQVSPRVSDRIIFMSPGETLSETRFFTRVVLLPYTPVRSAKLGEDFDKIPMILGSDFTMNFATDEAKGSLHFYGVNSICK